MSLKNVMAVEQHVDVNRELDMIALEAAFVARVFQRLTKFLPPVRQGIEDAAQKFASSFAESAKVTDVLSKQERKAVAASKELSYVEFGENLISVPEGFNGSYIEYLAVVNDVLPKIQKFNSTLLAEYNTILAAVITNKDDKISLRDHTALFKKSEKEREAIVSELTVFFDGSNNAKQKISSVIRNMKDIELIAKELATTRTYFREINLSEIKDSLKKSTDMLGLLTEAIEEDNAALSGPVTMNIATGAYEIGKYVEMVSGVYYDVSVLTNKIEELFEAVIKAQ